VRLIPRLILAAALAALPAGFALASCATDAQGVDACRKIEEARCQVAPLCSPGFDVDRCTRFYRDQCLVGIQNTTNTTDPNTLAQPCVDAINAAAACATADGGATVCPGADLVPDASCTEVSPSDPTACNVILFCPEVLAACAFTALPADAGTDTSVAEAGDAASD
jgi:hypothetical protein